MAVQQEKPRPNFVIEEQGEAQSQVFTGQRISLMRESDGNTGRRYVEEGSIEGTADSGDDALFLKSKVEVDSAYTSSDLGYIKLIASHRKADGTQLKLVPGSTYKLSFDMYCLVPWQFFVSDGSNADILPGVLVYSPTAGDGSSKDAVLMSGNSWIKSNEPVSGNELSPFVNKIDNGDFHDISDTSIVAAEELSADTNEEEFTVDNGSGGDAATSGNSLNKIFLSDGTDVPGSNYNDTIGVCTEVNSGQLISFHGYKNSSNRGSQITVDNNHKLYTLDGWKINGSEIWPNWLSTNMVHSESNHTLGISYLDGGRNGSSALQLSTNDTIGASTYTNPTPNSGSYLYQEVDLDGNCYYDLHFRYSQASVPSVDGKPSSQLEDAVTSRLVYDVYDKTNSESLTGGWQIADYNAGLSDTVTEGVTGGIGGNYVNFCFAEQNPYYAHCNQYYDDTTDTLKFGYVRIYVPPRTTESDSVTVSVRFSIQVPTDVENLYDENHSVRLSYVALKKSFPDLVHLSTGANKLCPARGVSKQYGIESHGNKFYDKWQNYGLTFTVPEDLSETNDWEIRIYGGSYGVTKTRKAAMVTGVTESGGTAQYTTSSAHGFSVGDRVTVSGTTNFNDDKLSTNDIKAVASTTFDLLVLNAGDADESSLTANAEIVNSSNYINTQVVGIKNIKLLSNNYKSGEEFSDHLLILPDNKTDRTTLTMYHTNNNYWDVAFYQSNSFKFSPVYSYINGLLQISDSEFSTGDNNLVRWFYLDRVMYGEEENYKNFVTTNNVFPSFEDIVVTQQVTPSLIGFNVDALRILGHQFNYQNWEFWPKEDFTGFQSTAPTAVNPAGNEGWNYKHFHRTDNLIGEDGNYGSKWNKYIHNIPIKYLPENLSNINTSHGEEGTFFRYKMGFVSFQSDGSFNWRPGGETYSCYTDVSGYNDWLTGIGSNQVVNNPIYIPLPGNNGNYNETWGDDYENADIYGNKNSDLTRAIESQLSYAFELDDDFLNIASLQIKLNLSGIAIESTNMLSDGYALGTGDFSADKYLRGLYIPKIKIEIYDLNINDFSDIGKNVLNSLIEDQGASSYLGTNLLASAQYPPSSDSIKFKNVEGAIFQGYNNLFQEYNINNSYKRFDVPYEFNLAFSPDGDSPSTTTSRDNLMIKITLLGEDSQILSPNDLSNILGFTGLTVQETESSPNGQTNNMDIWDFTTNLGISFSEFIVRFHEPDTTAGSIFGQSTGLNDLHINFNFITQNPLESEEEETEESFTDTDEFVVDSDSWVSRKFKVGATTLNHFNEESSITEVNTVLGDSTTVQPGQSPNVAIAIGKSIINNPLNKEVKIYLKDEEQGVWYKQLTINTQTVKLKSSTSNEEYAWASETQTAYILEIKSKDMLFFNEVDSYESETLISQKDAEKSGNLICTYKTSVLANNRLYVGNIYQNGRNYGDRMIKTPIGKYNVFPASNFIDVAIQDGDSITGLAYFKDKILQFKKRKVFVINISGDNEYLEDTFDHVGVNKQCQVVTTPYGICWANSNGCFLYDGESVENLIDDKIGTESFQPSGIAGDSNYWSILPSYSPSIGYIKSTKKLIVTKNTGYSNTAQTTSMGSQEIEGFTYDFQSKGWTLLMNKITGIEETSKPAKTGLLSNFVNNQDGDVLYYSVSASGDSGTKLNSIYKWDDSSIASSDASNNEDFFYLTTKDFDFGSPGIRKKIYKVYITFKSKQGDLAAHSNVKAYFGTNGSSSVTEFDNSSTNYSTTNGFSDGASSIQWITAELIPTNPINNIYSFQLQFKGIAANIANKFEINDITIVYREKNIK